MVADSPRRVFRNHAFDAIRLHKPHGAQWQRDAALHLSISQQTDFKAAAAQIKNHSRRDAFSERPQNRGAHQVSLFFTADHVEFDPGFAANPVDENVPITSLASCRSGNRPVDRNVMLVHHASKMPKGARGLRNRLAAQNALGESIVPETHRRAFVIEDFKSIRRCCAGDN